MAAFGHYIKQMMKKLLKQIRRLSGWWQHRWGEKSQVVAIAVLIGIVVSLASSVAHVLVLKCEAFAIWLTHTPQKIHSSAWMLVFLLLPLIGLAGSYLIQKYLGGAFYYKSLAPLILSLRRKAKPLPWTDTFTHLLSSCFSIGFGGSAGLEAPGVLTGAAIGSNGGILFGTDKKWRRLLIGCGAAAAISAVFNSPIGGVLFAAEVLLPEFSVSALVPMLISSAVATVVSRMVAGDHRYFFAITQNWKLDAIPFYFLCGLFCAAVGVYVIRVSVNLSEKIRNLMPNIWARMGLGGGILCILLFFFPLLRGQGYLYIGNLFSGDMDAIVGSAPFLEWIDSPAAVTAILILAGIFVKVIVSVLTLNCGGDGGIFAPAMFIGAFAGFGFARLVNLTGIVQLQEFNFVAVGMCGVFTAVMRAPLTGIFLIAEVTGGYILLVPLMIVSSVSFFVSQLFERNSVYCKELDSAAELDVNTDQSLLKRILVRTRIKRSYHELAMRDPMSKLIALVENTSDEVFPVLDADGKLKGLIYLEKIRAAMLNPDMYQVFLAFDLMTPPQGVLSPDDDFDKAMHWFEKYNEEHLPVCEPDGRFLGFVDKTTVFDQYRELVREKELF